MATSGQCLAVENNAEIKLSRLLPTYQAVFSLIQVWYAQWMGVGLQNQCSQFDSDTRLKREEKNL